jgi:hypothetical protein
MKTNNNGCPLIKGFEEKGIPQSALGLPPNTKPHSGPHTSQQSPFTIEKSPISRISKVIYQVKL